MKKIPLLLLTLVCVLLCAASCSGKCKEHTYGEWTTETAATCTATGTRVRTCTKCGEKETDTIAVLDHNYGEWSIKTAATCSTAGERHRFCTVCNNENVEATAALDHIYGNEYFAVDGGHARKCVNCDAYSATVAHVGGTPATETEDQTCTVCGAVVAHATGHILKKTEAKAATCAVDGNIEYYTCETCHKMYKDDKGTVQVTNVTVRKLGHLYAADPTCTEGQTCTREGCNHTVQALGHNYQVTDETALTCTQDQTKTYTCSHCNDTYTVIEEHATGHNITSEWVKTGADVLIPGETCKYTRTYNATCDNEGCEGAVKTETVVIHSYKGVVTKAATCQEEGDKTYTCQKEGCTEHYVTHFSDTTAHAWDAGVDNGTVKTYTCQNDGCTAQQTEYSGNSATVSADEAKKGAIKLDQATIDASQAGLGDENLTLGAENKTGLIQLPEDIPQDSTVYEFTMAKASGDVHEFDGQVTVKIPYTLGEDEDPDNIAIYYITEDGVALEPIHAIYQEDANGNGYAVFTVTHFSYYTVTRLTVEERCRVFGHDYGFNNRGIVTFLQSCTTDGYTLKTCLRCGDVTIENFMPATGHDFAKDTVNSVAATCTTAGKDVYDCRNDGCSEHYEAKVPAKGHKYEEVTDSKVPATCTAAGSVTVACKTCHESHTEVIPQQAHVYTDVVTPATCLKDGYTTHTCNTCHTVLVDSFVPATGHDYTKTVVATTCTTDGYTTYTCKNCSVTYNADVVPASHTKNIDEPTCGESVVCTVCGKVLAEATGAHNLVDGVCTVCGKGCTHNYEESTVAATCETAGYTLKKCSVCGREEKSNYTAALGHTGDFNCTRCGISFLKSGFFTNCYRSVSAQKFGIVLRNMKMSMPQYDYSTSTTATMTQELSFGELYLDFDEEGSLIGYGSGVMRMTYGATKANLKIRAIIKDSTVYVELSGADFMKNMNYSKYDDMNTTYYITMPFSYVYDSMHLPMENPGAMVVDTLRMLEKNFLPILIKVEETNGAATDKKMAAAVKALFTMQRDGSDYVFTLSTDALKEFLACETISAMYDKLYGEGEFDLLRTEVVTLATGTVGDFINWLKARGLDIDDLFAAGDAIAKEITGDDEATLNDLIAMIPGAAEGDETPDIAAMLESMKDMTFASFVLKKPDAQITDEERAQFKTMIEGYFDMAGETNVYDLIARLLSMSGGSEEPDYDITDQPSGDTDVSGDTDTDLTPAEDLEQQREAIREMVESILDSVKKYGKFSFTTDENGKLKLISLSVKIDDLSEINPKAEGSVSFTLSVIGDYKTQGDYSDIPSYTEENVVLDEDTFKAYDNNPNLEFVYDDDGNLLAVVMKYTKSFYTLPYNNKRARLYSGYTLTYNFGSGPMIIQENCMKNGALWLYVSKVVDYTEKLNPYMEVYDETTGTWVRTEIPAEILSTMKNFNYFNMDHQYLMSCENYEQKSSRTYEFLYDTKNGRAVIPTFDNHGYVTGVDSLHEYVEDESTAIRAEGCEGIGERHYVCKHCGKMYTEYYMNGHRNLSYTGEFVTPGATSCSDSAVKVTATCNDCHKVISEVEYDAGYHHEYPREVIDLTKYGSKCGGTVTVMQCHCGKDRYIRTDSECDITEDAGWVYVDKDGNYITSEQYDKLWKESDDSQAHNPAEDYIACRRYACPACGFSYYEFSAEDPDATYACTYNHNEYYAFGKVKADIAKDRLVPGDGGLILFAHTNGTGHNDDYRTKYDNTTIEEDSNGRVLKYRNGYSCAICGKASYWEYENTYVGNAQYTVKETYISSDGHGNGEQRVEEYKHDLPLYDSNGNPYTDGNGRTHLQYLAKVTYTRIREGVTVEIQVSEYTHGTTEDGYCDWTETVTVNGRVQENPRHINCIEFENRFGIVMEGLSETPATCTQNGSYNYFCRVCRKSGTATMDATGHHWEQVDKDLFVCNRCHMTSPYGANGSIDLEDLTELIEEGENAGTPVNGTVKIGYRDRKNVNFTNKFTVTFKLTNGDLRDYTLDFSEEDLHSEEKVMLRDNGSIVSFKADEILKAAKASLDELIKQGEFTSDEIEDIFLTLNFLPMEESDFVYSVTYFSASKGYLVNQ